MRLPRSHQHATAYTLTGQDGSSCVLYLSTPSAGERVEAEGAFLVLQAKYERQQLQLAQYKLGKRATPPDTRFTLSDFDATLRFVVRHVVEIDGLLGDDDAPLTRAEVDDEALCQLILSCGVATITDAAQRLITQGGLDGDSIAELLEWLRQKPSEGGDSRLAASLYTRYRIYADPQGVCPLDAPSWVKDVHACVKQVQTERAAEALRIQEQKEIAEKYLKGK